MPSQSTSPAENTTGDSIVIISGSFRPEYSYQENIWAEHLAGRGIRVSVITASATDEKPYENNGYMVYPLRCRGVHARHLYIETDVGQTVADLMPDRILWFGPPQLFGRSVLSHSALAETPIAIFMGQNRHMHAFDWRERGLSIRQRAFALAYRFIRGGTVAEACRRSHLVVVATPETADILRLFLSDDHWAQVEPKIMECPLGFDESTFFFDETLHRTCREDFGIGIDETVLLLTSRFSPEKWPTIAFTFGCFETLLSRHAHLHCLVVGLGDDVYSQRLREMTRASEAYDRIHLVNFTDRKGLARVLNAADFAVFRRPSISCQEALGTGAQGVFADDGTMDWLVEDTDDGVFFRLDDQADAIATIEQAILRHAKTSDRMEARRARGERARRLSYGRLIDSVLFRLGTSRSD